MKLLTTFLLLGLGLGAAQATTYEVKVGAGGADVYAPATLPALRVGDAVKFTWVSGTHPTVSDSSPEAWPMFTLSATNLAQTITFSKVGSYPYHCTTHAYQTSTGYAGMVGSITVQAALATTVAGQTPIPGLSVYPNPAHGQTTVQVSGPSADYQLRLSNVLGSEVRRLAVRPEGSPTEPGVALDLSSLPPGLYFCSLLAGDKTVATRRLTVL